MKYLLIKLKPKGPYHIGEREGWLEGTKHHVPSDTLFSALGHCYLLLYGQKELDTLLTSFREKDPPFLISSAFPYFDQTLFFPVPKNQIPKERKSFNPFASLVSIKFQSETSACSLSDRITFKVVRYGELTPGFNNDSRASRAVLGYESGDRLFV